MSPTEDRHREHLSARLEGERAALAELEAERDKLEAARRRAWGAGDRDAEAEIEERLADNREQRAARAETEADLGILLREIDRDTRLRTARELLPSALEALEAREAAYRETFGSDGFSGALSAFERAIEAIESEAAAIAVRRAALVAVAELFDLDVPEFDELPALSRDELRKALEHLTAGLSRSPFRPDPAQLLRQVRRRPGERGEAAAHKLAELAGGDLGELIRDEVEARALERELVGEHEDGGAE